MATARLVLTANNGPTKQALRAVATILDGLSQLRRVKAEQDMMLNGEAGPAAGTQAATEYGLAGGAADGLAVCTVMNNALAAVDVAAVRELARLDQGPA